MKRNIKKTFSFLLLQFLLCCGSVLCLNSCFSYEPAFENPELIDKPYREDKAFSKQLSYDGWVALYGLNADQVRGDTHSYEIIHAKEDFNHANNSNH